jgi:spore maturation protein SpmB
MIPISIIIRLIQEFNILPYISTYLDPVMKLCGLPAEMSLVWITAMIVNIYGGILSLFAIYPSLSEPLSSAQLTILLTMILIAHTFPIELKIAQKAGVRFGFMLLFRFGCGIVFGMILSFIYSTFNMLQEPVQLSKAFVVHDPSWKAWVLNELKNYMIIICIIFSLILAMRILELTGFMRRINQALHPIIKTLGISDEVLPITLIGLTLGIAYGGGLVIEESRRKQIKPKDIFYSLILMGLFHSIFEDTLLMLGMGGHYSGIIIFRFVMAFIITFAIVRLTKNMKDETFNRIFITKNYIKKIKTANV